MAEDDQAQKQPIRTDSEEFTRSIDPQTIIDAATAYGAATGGTGTFLLGVAAVKKVLGGGQESATPAETQPQTKGAA